MAWRRESRDGKQRVRSENEKGGVVFEENDERKKIKTKQWNNYERIKIHESEE